MSTPTIQQPRRILATLALCMGLQMTGFVMILPLFARRFESFGDGVEALGMSAMAYALTSAFTAPFIGMLADRTGRRPIILISLAGYVLAFSGYLFAASSWLLIVLRGMSGIFTAGLLPAITSVAGNLAPENRRAQWISIVGGGASAGWVAGPILGGLLYDQFGYAVPFAASIALAFAALLLAVFLIPETSTPAVQRLTLRLGWMQRLRALPVKPAVFLPMLIAFGVMFAWAFIEPQFMFYVYDDLGWTSSQLGNIMSTYGAAFMLGEFALGRLSDRLGRRPVLVLGLALFSAQFIGLVVSRQVTWIVASFILAGLGNALYDPALSALILDITPAEHITGMLGLKNTASSLGNLLGPGLVVLLTPFTNPQVVFLIAAALVVILALASGYVARSTESIKMRNPWKSHATGG